ncbi:hypothetical protein DFJ58DRAFT_912020 [Suillus subalutaceus]|uniref:uncharacterized protein n=1 Tax=Suillus subalutaceus TaxID=48586 RepID=UPI001B86F1AB|nr:uncharacterized protein DFJ58DRAFT_912020 [Suillus subalutaceus]KAG1864945.1 hypothetical protein DFJ58DRAFT_912020 [Suillus subalutaceus]
MVALFYASRMSVVALVFHSVAILCTIFRLAYRGWMHHSWWEDAWAAFALIGDAVCLACIWLDSPSITFWILMVAFTSVQWAARMSVIFSIIRITNHSNFKIHRQITYFIAVSFACMWVALLAHRITLCAFYSCLVGKSVALSLLITDVIADISLVAAPLYLWRNVGLSRSTRYWFYPLSAHHFLNTATTIPHSIIVLKAHKINAIMIIVTHVKTALSLVICDLLVIATAIYHVFWKETFDPRPVMWGLHECHCSTDALYHEHRDITHITRRGGYRDQDDEGEDGRRKGSVY